jgi:hypothetical protein
VSQWVGNRLPEIEMTSPYLRAGYSIAGQNLAENIERKGDTVIGWGSSVLRNVGTGADSRMII